MKRRFKFCLLLFGMDLLAGSLIGCGFLPGFKGGDLGYSYVTLSINPTVDFVINGKGMVEHAICGNEDAEVLLVDEDLSGLKFEDAAERFVKLAAEAGYIDVDSVSNEVIIEVVGERDSSAQIVAERIRAKVNSFFENNCIFGSARVQTLEKYLERAQGLSIISGLAPEKLRLILAALEQNPELDLEEIEGLTVGELIRLIRDGAKSGNVPPSLREQLRQAIEQLKESEFAELLALREEIKALKEQVGQTEDGEEKEALLAQLKENLQRYNDLKQSFNEKVNQLKEQFRQQWEQGKDDLVERKRERINEFKERLEEHISSVRENLEKVREEIRKKQNEGRFNPFVSDKELAEGFEQALEKLNQKYAEMFKLKEEIEQLKRQFTGYNAGNRIDLIESLKEKEGQYVILYEQYKIELDELIKDLRKNKAEVQPGGSRGQDSPNVF